MRLALIASAVLAATVPQEGKSDKVTVTWYGHSFFTVSAGRLTVAFDPYDGAWGYKVQSATAQICCCSHEHGDHNNVAAINGMPMVLRQKFKNGATTIGGLKFTHVVSDHGGDRGQNTMFAVELNGVRFAHCGDLCEILSDEQVLMLGRVDVLFIPVGGKVVLNAKEADEVIKKLKPRIVVPMHYKTKEATWLASGVDEFLKGKDAASIKRIEDVKFEVDKQSLPSDARPVIYVMKYQQ
ncbi:MAG: MBL fold metallo-hydrolase [Planctomycetes bacterium]|nr:MBL fold metallo-hydrolase [Planctomycetota bacterium]